MGLKIRLLNLLIRLLNSLVMLTSKFNNFLFKSSGFLKSLFAVILAPQALIKYNKACYGEDRKLRIFGMDKVSDGLSDIEKEFIGKYNLKKGRCLVLGCGGGREVIALTKDGIDAIGIDFIEKMVDKAKENAQKDNLKLKLIVGDFTRLFFKPHSFDFAMITSCMYGSIPARKNRVSFLKQLKLILKEEAKLYISFLQMAPRDKNRLFFLRKLIAFLSWGNIRYQSGDRILPWNEFHHLFVCKEEFINEAKQANFRVDNITKDEYGNFYAAVLI